MPSNDVPPTAQAAPQPDRRHNKNRKLLVLLPILVVGAVIAGVVYWLHARQYENTNDAFIDGNIVPISAKVPGTIESIEIQDNEDVAAGTVLLRIDPRSLRAKRNEAKASLEAAKARLEAAKTNVELVRANAAAALTQAQAGVEQATAGIGSNESELASAQAYVAAAQAEAIRRQTDFERYQSLDPRAVSQQQLDGARAQAESADAALIAAQKRVSAAEASVTEARARTAHAEGTLAAAQTGPQQIAAAEAQVKTAQAAVEQAQAALDEAELNLSYTTVVAPVAGRVARRTARQGQYLQVGQIILAIVQPDVWVTANFKESQISHMSTGQDVRIKVDAYPNQVFHGKVQSIQAGSGARFSMLPPENATGNYVKVVQRIPVKIVFDSDVSRQWLLAPGMSVVPSVHVGVGGKQRPLPIDPMTASAATPASN